MKRMYPDDGGLKEPVRNFSDTPSVVKILVEHFTKNRNVGSPDNR